MDGFGSRSRLLAGLDTAYSEVQARLAETEAGQASLFDDASAIPRTAPPLPSVSDWSESERLAREKEALGFFISGHPLNRYREIVRAYDVSSYTLVERPGELVQLPCVVTSVARQISRRDSSEWGKITVEDFSGTATVLAFGDSWRNSKDTLQQDAVIEISGRVSGRERDEEDPPIFLDTARALEDVTPELAVQIDLELGSDVAANVFKAAKQVITNRPGPSPVWLKVGSDNGEPVPGFRSRSMFTEPNEDTLSELEKLFGSGNVRLVRTTRTH